VERACEQIRCSDRLAYVLSRVLATGNILNADTHRGNALAIKLDSLSKMSDVKVSPDIGLKRAQDSLQHIRDTWIRCQYLCLYGSTA
jgi:hypothetical protein